jgi:hypothetical protein
VCPPRSGQVGSPATPRGTRSAPGVHLPAALPRPVSRAVLHAGCNRWGCGSQGRRFVAAQWHTARGGAGVYRKRLGSAPRASPFPPVGTPRLLCGCPRTPVTMGDQSVQLRKMEAERDRLQEELTTLSESIPTKAACELWVPCNVYPPTAPAHVSTATATAVTPAHCSSCACPLAQPRLPLLLQRLCAWW